MEKPFFKKYSKEDYINLIGAAIEKSLKKDCLIIFFGSILNNRFNRTSDIDVAVFCKNELTSKDLLKIEDSIDKLPILREVDIVDIRKVKNVELLENIVKGRIWRNIPELLKDLKKHIQNLKKS